MMPALVATRTSVELLRFHPQLPKTGYLFEALLGAAASCGVDVSVTGTYHGRSDLLMLWGPGAPNRFDVMARHRGAGGHVVVWDAAYWHRDQKFRVSIDDAHPSQWVMRRDWPRDRLKADRVIVSDHWNPNGPVIIAGLGKKARRQFGPQVDAWEAEMMRDVHARRRGTLWYRRKPGTDAGRLPPYVHSAPMGPIAQILRGAALVITWHSNVAVDAIIQGIPVICRDGAAAAVCPSMLSEAAMQPLDPAVRARFLANLSWFQWGTAEAAGCWAFLQELLS